jgi:glycosyltransferase involved in cell wall biosynthesis
MNNFNIEKLKSLQEKITHKNFYNGQLCNDPKPIEGQSEPVIIFLKENDERDVEFSIVVPVFNQENIIRKNLHSMMKCTEGLIEIIVILDNCVDNTENEVLDLFKTETVDNLVRVIVVRQDTPVYETTADNIGFVLSSGKYLLEIQADIELTEPGYNRSMQRALIKYDDIAVVSGRLTHRFGIPHGVGKLGETNEKPLPPELDRNKVYMWGTCVHSPFLMDHAKAKEIGYFDEQNIFLEGSCHDYCARCYYLKGWKNGYVPVEYLSPLKDGSCRKNLPDTVKHINKIVMEARQARSNGGFLAYLLANLHKIEQPKIEIRDL